RSWKGPHPGRDHRRRARGRADRRADHGDEAPHRAEQDPRYDPYLSHAGRGEQVRRGRMEEGACAGARAARTGALSRVAARLKLSIVIPALNEGERIGAALQALAPLRARGCEVIVVDGGSADRTCELAAPLCDRLVSSARGRAVQMNCGARDASGEALL